MSKTLVIYCHPYEKSFNHAIFQRIVKHLEDKKQEVEIIDLYKDKFDPCYSKEELALFKHGKTLDPLVEKYQKSIKNAEKVIMIAPVWWNDVPAILKGFIDKVMKMDFAYEVTKTGVKGRLNNVQETVVITTSTSPTWYLRWFIGNPIGKIFVNRTLKQVGFQKRKWIQFGGLTNSQPSQREKFLQDIIHKI